MFPLLIADDLGSIHRIYSLISWSYHVRYWVIICFGCKKDHVIIAATVDTFKSSCQVNYDWFLGSPFTISKIILMHIWVFIFFGLSVRLTDAFITRWILVIKIIGYTLCYMLCLLWILMQYCKSFTWTQVSCVMSLLSWWQQLLVRLIKYPRTCPYHSSGTTSLHHVCWRLYSYNLLNLTAIIHLYMSLIFFFFLHN